MAVITSDCEKVLLGRKKNLPAGLYGCGYQRSQYCLRTQQLTCRPSGLAGFVEPGESFEDAVRREVFEETGLKVGPVYYHSSQPWFPASLMFGVIAQLLPGQQNIRLDLDNELESARFFNRKEILHALQVGNFDKPMQNVKNDDEEDDQAQDGPKAPFM